MYAFQMAARRPGDAWDEENVGHLRAADVKHAGEETLWRENRARSGFWTLQRSGASQGEHGPWEL